MKLSLKDILMLLLYAKGYTEQQYEPIKERTRLMKMVFLFDKEIKHQIMENNNISIDLPDFEAYNYGPFTEEVYDDINFLNNLGLIKIEETKQVYSEEEQEEIKNIYDNCILDIPLYEDDYRLEEVFKISNKGKKFVKEYLLKKMNNRIEIIDKFKFKCNSFPLKTLLRYVYDKYEIVMSKRSAYVN